MADFLMQSGPISGEKGYELNNDLFALQSLWRSELNAPEILPFQETEIESLKDFLERQQNMVDDLVDAGDEKRYFTITLYQMDIDRVRFALIKYLRARILKIETQLEAIVASQVYIDRLSREERRYITQINRLNHQYFEENIGNRLTETGATYYRTNEDRYHHALPNLEKFVFVQFMTDVNSMYVAEDTYQSYGTGDIAILRYRIVKDYLADGRIQLL